MKTTYHSKVTGHTLFTNKVDSLPSNITQDTQTITGSIYEVRNFDKDGVIFFYIAKTSQGWYGWYGNGKFWSGWGKNVQEAIEGMQKDGWMHTR